MRMNHIVLFVLLFTTLPEARAEKRSWTSSDGRSTFEGELLESSATEVTIKRTADLKTFKMPINKLSGKDQDYIKSLLEQGQKPGLTSDGSLMVEDAAEDFRKNEGLILFTPEDAERGMDFVKGVFRQLDKHTIRINLTMSKPIEIEKVEYLLRVSVNSDNDVSTGFHGWTPGEDCRAYFKGKKWNSIVTSDFKSSPGKGSTVAGSPSQIMQIEKARMTRNYFEFEMKFEEPFQSDSIGLEVMTMKEGDESRGIPYVCLDSLTEQIQIKLPVSK